MKTKVFFDFFITIFCLIFIPDLILSISGRDTYLFYRYPVLVNIGILAIIIFFILFTIEVVRLIAKKKWIKTVSLLFGVFLFLFACKISTGILINKSVSEARQEVEVFFEKNDVGESWTINIEDEVRPLYRKYITDNFSKDDLQLMWKSPQYGKYEFKISSDHHSFLVRLSILQDKPNEIWVHKVD